MFLGLWPAHPPSGPTARGIPHPTRLGFKDHIKFEATLGVASKVLPGFPHILCTNLCKIILGSWGNTSHKIESP